MNALTLFLPCAAGVETYLADEVQRITGVPAGELRVGRAGVELAGSWRQAQQLNLHSRLAQRVLVRLARQPYRSEQDVYGAAAGVAWEIWFTPQRTLKVEITAQHSPLKSLNFAALRVKDAICDRLRDKRGERPSVDTARPDVRVFAHLTHEDVSVYIDTSGEPLFKRGWREDKGDAPLKETLAAAMIAATGWTGWDEQGRPVPLYDPCCGSGTVLIEAAQVALNLAPGRLRRFAFEKLLPHQPHVWQALKQEAQAAERPLPPGTAPFIFGSDVAFRMVDFARRNAERAGVMAALELRGGDALQRLPPSPTPGVMLLNPPYGERIAAAGVAGQRAATRARETAQFAEGGENTDFFAQLATHWKKHYAGWSAWLLTPDLKLPSQMRFKESRRVPLWNGPIECRLFRFDLMAGSARGPKPGPATGTPPAP
ncbi:class I SAM-dependent RNA methyltransferase [Aquabacterium sp. A08]|uniref:THUMP domain-containing class I SAM-dependent RNA methyltransferase n=1 Tax=Aquabacterium sp. A08 TaxID=2718532 RepID=UPI001422DBF9|nr:THUMP domain-containing protein [Aquabacterium sp. A08]NIC43278.1 class I SAM-dependent RNA methyltransferase [Aquabacterium sp. A08]